MASLDIVDPCDQMETTTWSKWKEIAQVVNVTRHSILPKNNMAYKDKGGAIYGDFKHMFDYMIGIFKNNEYWDLIL